MQMCPNCGEIVNEKSAVCSTCGHIIKLNESTSGQLNYLAHPVPKGRPGCVTAAAIALGLSAIPPTLKGLMVIINGPWGDDFDFFSLQAFYWGDVILSLMLAWGLWHLRDWARILTIITFSLVAVLGIIISGGSGIILLPIFGYIIYWFASNGKYFTSLGTVVFQDKQETRKWERTSDHSDPQSIVDDRADVAQNEQEIKKWDKTSEYPDPHTIAGYVFGAIGIIVGLWGVQSFLGDSDVLGLYFGLCPATLLILIAWGLLKI